jgi:hypothetical protein
MTKDCVKNISTVEFCNLVVPQNVTYSRGKTWNFKVEFEDALPENSKLNLRSPLGNIQNEM